MKNKYLLRIPRTGCKSLQTLPTTTVNMNFLRMHVEIWTPYIIVIFIRFINIEVSYLDKVMFLPTDEINCCHQ